MDVDNIATTRRRRFLILLLRGVVGGAAGGFVFAAGEICLMRPNGIGNWLGYFIIIYLIFGLPFGLFSGFILSIGLWLIDSLGGRSLGTIARATIGTIFAMIASAIVLYTNASDQPSDIQSSWAVDLFGIFLLGVAFGGIPALIIGKVSERSINALGGLRNLDLPR